MINLEILLTSAFLASALTMTLAAFSQYIVQRAGLFSTAPVAFIAIGAYASTYFIMQVELPTPVSVALAVALCAALGALLGRLVAKLRGAYVAIATLSVVLVIQQVATMWTPVTGGPLGITNIPVWASNPIMIVMAAATVASVFAFDQSALGKRQAAMRLDEVAAASVGVDVVLNGVIASTLSSAIAGLAGAVTAGNLFAIEPTAFGFGLVVALLSAVVIGGYRSALGPVLGAFAIVGLPLVFSGQAMIAGSVVGLVTIVILRFVPRGLAGAIPLATLRLLRARPSTEGSPREAKGTAASSETLEIVDRGELVATSIARSYGKVKAVQNISIAVAPGQIVGLIGPNGAGKTSVINLLAGLTALDSGTVSLGRREIHRLPAFRIARLGVVRSFQACRLFHELPVVTNVQVAASSGRSKTQRSRLSDRQAAHEALRLVGYRGSLTRKAEELSYADQRRVEIARALATEPSFILLDEPAAGMTASESAELETVLRRIAGLGIGVLVIDHNVSWIFSVCDVVSVQHLGRLIAAGAPEDVRKNPVVISAYTGQTPEKEEVRKDPVVISAYTGQTPEKENGYVAG